jgi:hypothetical protein
LGTKNKGGNRLTRTREQKETEIKTRWFPEHVAHVTEYDGITILDWKKAGTYMYSVRYVFSGHMLFISGDIGDAVFSLTWNGTVESFQDVDISYLLGKLTCSSRTRWDFDDQKAKRELDEWYAERLDDADDEDSDYVKEVREIYEAVESAIFESSSVDYFSHAVFRVYHEVSTQYVDSEDFSMISDFGKSLPHVFHAYLLGIKMAHEQLKEDE